jgi:hypothetical protein
VGGRKDGIVFFLCSGVVYTAAVCDIDR